MLKIVGTLMTLGIMPKERTAIFIGSEKTTSDPACALWFRLGKCRARAREFLVLEIGWSSEKFESVGWVWLDIVLSTKPVMFCIWLSKQHSNFCATGLNMRPQGTTDDNQCPSC
jgi:hypothetical protein